MKREPRYYKWDWQCLNCDWQGPSGRGPKIREDEIADPDKAQHLAGEKAEAEAHERWDEGIDADHSQRIFIHRKNGGTIKYRCDWCGAEYEEDGEYGDRTPDECDECTNYKDWTAFIADEADFE